MQLCLNEITVSFFMTEMCQVSHKKIGLRYIEENLGTIIRSRCPATIRSFTIRSFITRRFACMSFQGQPRGLKTVLSGPEYYRLIYKHITQNQRFLIFLPKTKIFTMHLEIDLVKRIKHTEQVHHHAHSEDDRFGQLLLLCQQFLYNVSWIH